jgi:hypothetical protein
MRAFRRRSRGIARLAALTGLAGVSIPVAKQPARLQCRWTTQFSKGLPRPATLTSRRGNPGSPCKRRRKAPHRIASIDRALRLLSGPRRIHFRNEIRVTVGIAPQQARGCSGFALPKFVCWRAPGSSPNWRSAAYVSLALGPLGRKRHCDRVPTIRGRPSLADPGDGRRCLPRSPPAWRRLRQTIPVASTQSQRAPDGAALIRPASPPAFSRQPEAGLPADRHCPRPRGAVPRPDRASQ